MFRSGSTTGLWKMQTLTSGHNMPEDKDSPLGVSICSGNSLYIDTAGLADAAKPLSLTFSKILSDFLGPAAVTGGAIVDDALRVWRLERAVRLLKRANTIARKSGLPIRSLPQSFLFPALDGAKDVEDPELGEMWAQLIASASTNEHHRHPRLIRALQQLAHNDATYFRELVCRPNPRRVVHYMLPRPPFEPHHSEAQTLLDLGLLQFGVTFCDDPPEIEKDPAQPPRSMGLYVGYFGWQFASAVMPTVLSTE